MHPDGTTVIIRNNIRHYEIEKYKKDYKQATSIVVENWTGIFTVKLYIAPPPPQIYDYKQSI